MKQFFQAFIGLLVLLVSQTFIFGQEAPRAKPSVTLECAPIFIRGFPAVLKLKCTGPQAIPTMTLFTYYQKFSVDLVSQETAKTYSIQSDAGSQMHTMGTNSLFLTHLPTGRKYTMLVDLYSLEPDGEAGLVLRDVPNGKYTIQVNLTYSGQKTIPIPVEIVAPTPKQQEFLDKIRERYLVSPRRYVEDFPPGLMPNWARFLEEPANMSDLMGELDPAGQSAMAMHFILSEIVLYPKKIEELDEQTLSRLSAVIVPQYLQIDKECLLLELKIIKGGVDNLKEEIDSLLQQDSGLESRIDRAKSRNPQYVFFNLSRKRRLNLAN